MNSQASQDIFVLGVLDNPKQGFYLEIGAAHPTEINNTFLMETMGWKGVSVDIDDCGNLWREKRKNTFIKADACKLNYLQVLTDLNAPNFIDYLTIDIDEATNLALKQVPFEQFKFKVITIEHDFYRLGDFLQPEQRKYLEDKGYVRICSNVCNGPEYPFEDWYLHSSIYQEKQLPLLENKNHDEIIKLYENHRNIF